MSDRPRGELAADLRWLAEEWRRSDPVLRLRIRQAFRRGLAGERFNGTVNFGGRVAS